jgi:hypothetical protein
MIRQINFNAFSAVRDLHLRIIDRASHESFNSNSVNKICVLYTFDNSCFSCVFQHYKEA